jgi:hypothetical protein
VVPLSVPPDAKVSSDQNGASSDPPAHDVRRRTWTTHVPLSVRPSAKAVVSRTDPVVAARQTATTKRASIREREPDVIIASPPSGS